MERNNLYWIGGAAIAGAAVLWLMTKPAPAADLGGNCCADLEERIAELEAATARKGNRKVTVTVTGEINKALGYFDWDASATPYVSINGNVKTGDTETAKNTANKWRVRDNSNAPSNLTIRGDAKIAPGWMTGYVLQLGVGGFGDGDVFGSTNDIYVHKSFWFIQADKFVRISLGHQSEATDDLDQITVANTAVATTPLSLRPLAGPQTTEVLDIFDGGRSDNVRVDILPSDLFSLSASWTPGSVDDGFDVAARFKNEAGGFAMMAGAGYRQGTTVNGLFGFSDVIPEDSLDLRTWTVVASVMHIKSGLFLTGMYGDVSGNADDGYYGIDGRGWALVGGIESKMLAPSLGRTTFFAEYGDATFDVSHTSEGSFEKASLDATYYGGGIVQNIESAATDLYLTIRKYNVDGKAAEGFANEDVSIECGDLLSADATVGMVGARVRF